MPTSADNPAKLLIKQLYYPEACKFSSAATTWGYQHEEDTIGEFLDQFYLDVTFDRCGIRLSKLHPFMGASPDGMCHIPGPEVKCPYSCKQWVTSVLMSVSWMSCIARLQHLWLQMLQKA